MGKKKKGLVCNNPVAMARAAGPPPITGPTIRDYLDRARPSLEEAAGIIASQHNRKESGALAAYEEQLNETHKQELKERRVKLLAAGSSRDRSRSREKKKKKKKDKKRERSRSRTPLSSPCSHGDTSHTSSRHDHSKSSHKKKHRHKKHSIHGSSHRHSSDEVQSSED